MITHNTNAGTVHRVHAAVANGAGGCGGATYQSGEPYQQPRRARWAKPEDFEVPDFDFQRFDDDAPRRRSIDWCELGWRVAPYACAIAVAILVYALGQS